MALSVRFFAALRDRMGRPEQTLETLPANGDALIALLLAKEERADALNHPSVRIIINDEIADRTTPLKAGDTIAFCPPFSGG